MELINKNITVGTALVDIHQSVNTSSISSIGVEISLLTQPFDAFEIQCKFHKDGEWVTLFNTVSDFTSPSGILVGASGDLTTLSAGSTGWFIMETESICLVRLRASCAVAGGIVNVYGGGD